MHRSLRILMLAPRVPYPPVGGDRLRLFEILRSLARRHRITLVAMAEPGECTDEVREVLGREVEAVHLFPISRAERIARCSAGLVASRLPLQVHYFSSRAGMAALRRLAAEADVVLASLIRTAPYALASGRPTVVDVQDSISLNYRRALPMVDRPTRVLYRLELPRVERYERVVAEAADGISLVSPVDLADLRLRARPKRAVLAGNGVHTDRFSPGADPAPTADRVVFLGNLRTVANRDMAARLASEILPGVRRRRPRAELHVVGVEAGPSVRRLDDGNSVRVVGPVDDPAEPLREAWVTACPMRLGAGVANKVLESLSCGTPVVLTPMAADALGLADGDGVRIARGTDGLVQALVDVLSDADLRARLSARARQVAVERFDWADALAPLEDLLIEVAEEG